MYIYWFSSESGYRRRRRRQRRTQPLRRHIADYHWWLCGILCRDIMYDWEGCSLYNRPAFDELASVFIYTFDVVGKVVRTSDRVSTSVVSIDDSDGVAVVTLDIQCFTHTRHLTQRCRPQHNKLETWAVVWRAVPRRQQQHNNNNSNKSSK